LNRIIRVVAFLCLAVPAFAQNVAGTITGLVQDPSGAVVPKAVITIKNNETNISFRTVTAESGEYIAPNLNPGLYEVQVEVPGFRPARATDARLLANRTLRVDFTLQTGAVNQTVEVQAAAPVINSESATIGNVMESRTITTLPLNGRTLDRLIRISAGVTTDSASNPRVAGSAYWGGIQFNTDGVVFNDGGNGGGAYSYRNGLSTLPSVDSVSEFKMDSNNQKAEFEGSASVTIVSKSGTTSVPRLRVRIQPKQGICGAELLCDLTAQATVQSQ
jgi:hypothetical protein